MDSDEDYYENDYCTHIVYATVVLRVPVRATRGESIDNVEDMARTLLDKSVMVAEDDSECDVDEVKSVEWDEIYE